MIDTRELILARLLTAVSGVTGIVVAARNVDEINESQRPAAIVFDGDEEADTDDPRRPRNRPRIVTMTPQVLILLGDDPRDAGTALNTLRARTIAAINADDTLAGHTLNNDGAIYIGFESNMEPGRTGEAWGILSFAFPYLLKQSDLTA